MDRRRFGWIVVILLLVAGSGLADQGAPVYQANNAKPTQGGNCNGERVQIEYDTGKIWCCGAGGAGLWGACGSVVSLNTDPAACGANQYASDISASGALTCSQPNYNNLSNLPTLLTLSSSNPVMNGTAAPGSGTTASKTDHVHPTDTSRAPTVGPTFTGTTTASGPLALASVGTATAGVTTYDSQPIQFSGSYWNGSVATSITGGIALDVVGAASAKLSFSVAGSEKMSVNDAGVVLATAFTGAFSFAGVGTLPTCDGSLSGRMTLLRVAANPDRIYACLQNADATYGWSMFAIAVK